MSEQLLERCFDAPGSYLDKLYEEAIQGSFPERLVKDFRLSFRFSGSEFGQYALMYLLGIKYFQAGPVVQDAVSKSLALVTEQEWRAAAQPPREHLPLKDGHFEKESANEWHKFCTTVSPKRIAGLADEVQTGKADHYGDMLSTSTQTMIKKDIWHITRGRPGRPSSQKRFASFIRQYVLHGQSTGSPTFNAIFDDMRDAILVNPPLDIVRLATAWKAKHRGDDFYPPKFMEQAEHFGTQASFTYLDYLVPVVVTEEALLLRASPANYYGEY